MDLSSSLPVENLWEDENLYQYNGFWFWPQFLSGTKQVLQLYKPLDTDILLASFPKTGTTWLKSLIFSVVNRSSKNSLVNSSPHKLVPNLEVRAFAQNAPSYPNLTGIKNTSKRIFSTHIAYQLLHDIINLSNCRVVYVTRNPKDTIVSMWHFLSKSEKFKKPWPIEVAVEKFCSGAVPFGPYFDHVVGYYEESVKSPKKVFFLKYEDLKDDPITHVIKLAEFLGCPFNGQEEVQEIVRHCSFEKLSNYEVNKSNETPSWFELPYNSYFRKGEVGDNKNYLDRKMIERIDEITVKKFHGSGLMYGI